MLDVCERHLLDLRQRCILHVMDDVRFGNLRERARLDDGRSDMHGVRGGLVLEHDERVELRDVEHLRGRNRANIPRDGIE
jgi:hypothetical protein